MGVFLPFKNKGRYAYTCIFFGDIQIDSLSIQIYLNSPAHALQCMTDYRNSVL